MSILSILKKDTNIDMQENNINDLVASASRVIAPLWPISTFAAHHPWMGLEKQSFEQVADWLKEIRNVDIYPSAAMIHSAKAKGEIEESFLQSGLSRWLDSQSFHIPRKKVEQFCQVALKLEELPSSLLSLPEVNKLAEEMSYINTESMKDSSLQPVSSLIENQKGENLSDIINYHIIKWCKLYLDDSGSSWTMPNREKGFYRAWQHLIKFDPALSKNERKVLKDWPQDAQVALARALSELGISESNIQAYLEGHLLSLPGWAGMIRWRSQQSIQEQELLIEYLAVRISMELAITKPYLPLKNQKVEKKVAIVPLIASWIYWGNISTREWLQMPAAEQSELLVFAYRFDENIRRKLWLEAWEQTHAEQLRKKITSKQRATNDKKRVLAQLAFCIDVRSEPFRRHLEKLGPFETFGIAGFFGLPIATSELGSNNNHPSLPVILKPKHQIKELTNENELKSYEQRKRVGSSVRYTFKTMKQNVLTSMALPELSGPLFGLQMVTRSFVPRGVGGFIRNLRKTMLQKPDTTFSLNHVHDTKGEIPIGFTKEEKVNYVRQALKMVGLTEKFAPLVVMCGHSSQSTNNPYAAALECGACGGAAGGFNARVFATLCNLPEVREALFAEGIKIPEDTIFAAAEHKTTVDELEWSYVPKLSKTAQEAVDCIETIMPNVRQHANRERLSQLPNFKTKIKNPSKEAHRFAEDWSE
ncbi:Na-translocating system protein MpsB, partial [Bacillus thuringiensis]|uniref:putative inorganic carbon transporter subunit DabA n=1 Tax=Bacillus thuringiensis TaxID=1428 RepID=UPI002DBCCA2C